MVTYLTETGTPDCPRIQARSWAEAERKAMALAEATVTPMVVIGELLAEGPI